EEEALQGEVAGDPQRHPDPAAGDEVRALTADVAQGRRDPQRTIAPDQPERPVGAPFEHAPDQVGSARGGEQGTGAGHQHDEAGRGQQRRVAQRGKDRLAGPGQGEHADEGEEQLGADVPEVGEHRVAGEGAGADAPRPHHPPVELDTRGAAERDHVG
ncbi:hypothetical protein DIZ48_16020, partial [Legionella pneumophila]